MITAQCIRLFPAAPAGTRLALVLGLAIIAFWLVCAATVQFWPLDPPLDMVARRLQSPSAEYWLGTDALGRNVLSRTLHGARYSIPIAVVVVFAAVGIGSFRGAISGFVGGVLGSAIMRLVDVTLAFPPILLATAVAATLGPGLENAAIAMVVVWWPLYARLMRAQVLEVREREHVEAAVAVGAGPFRVLFLHTLPLCWTPTMVNATRISARSFCWQPASASSVSAPRHRPRNGVR